MPTFLSLDEISQSLKEMQVPLYVQKVQETVRPVVLFTRRQMPDDPLPTCTSKVGGFPDLPIDFPWPERPAFPDAERSAEQFRREAERTRALFE